MYTQNSNTPHNRDTNKKLVKILHSLLEMQESAPFRKPVPHKALGLGDYKKIIKKPIDLNQIRRQNNQSKYKTIQEALDDIELCWENCKLYNHGTSEVFQQALNLQKIFWKMIQQNFPEIYALNHSKLKEVEGPQKQQIIQPKKVTRSVQTNLQQQQPLREQKPLMVVEQSSEKIVQQQLDESKNSRMDEEEIDSVNDEMNEIKSQKSSVKQQQKQPIIVSLKEGPSADNITKLTNHLKKIEDKAILEQVLQILFTYEKENMVSSPKGTMYFKIQHIHLSTFHRICKVTKFEPQQQLQIIQ